jgi:elongation factor Ts
MQIAATNPIAIDRTEVPSTLIEKEKNIFREQLEKSGKPAAVVEKIVEGKLEKFYETACLLDQTFIKNDKIKIKDYLNELVAKINENIKIKRFTRFQIGG